MSQPALEIPAQKHAGMTKGVHAGMTKEVLAGWRRRSPLKTLRG